MRVEIGPDRYFRPVDDDALPIAAGPEDGAA
jgi:hypothetical protein